MKKLLEISPFPAGAQSDGFFAALASAVLPCLGIKEESPYWCSPKGAYCTGCGGCGDRSNLQKHQEMMYHTLLAASGAAFTFDYPEDDSVAYHTMPGIPLGWRWEEPFVADLADFAGLSYERYTAQSVSEMLDAIRKSVDSGYTALVADHGQWKEASEWARCWNVVCGYTDDGLLVMRPGGEIAEERGGTHEDWIVFTGRARRKQTYRDILEKICAVLSDQSHDSLEQLIDESLSDVTPENAEKLAHMTMGINGVPIESRWHAAEAFCSCDNLLSGMTEDEALKSRLCELFFKRYIANDSGETHGTGWKIWGALGVGPATGYMPTDESYALIQRPEVQAEMKRLFQIVFANDRAVADGIRAALANLS